MSVPNQKKVIIQKPKYKSDFLQIGKSEWQRAAQELNYSEFKLYLYLSGNMDGYSLELSQKAVENATGVKRSSYYDAVNQLIEFGYIVNKQGNVYSFFTAPVRPSGNPHPIQEPPQIASVRQSGTPPDKTTSTPPLDIKVHESGNRPNGQAPPPEQTENSAQSDVAVRPGSREIDNIDNINKRIDRSVPSEKGKEQEGKNENDKYRELITKRLSALTESRRNEFPEISTTMISKRKSPRWIWTALSHKPNDIWEKYGFGLFFKPDYQNQIDTLIEGEDRAQAKLKAKQKEIAREIGAQMKKEPKIIIVGGKEEIKRPELIDLKSIGADDDEETKN